MWSMLKITSVGMRQLLYLSISCLLFISWSAGGKLESKVDMLIKKTFNLKVYTKEQVLVPDSVLLSSNKKIDKCLYRVHSKNNLEGYVYIGQSPSMKNIFDYAVLFDKDLSIINTKVLIYREQHGRQIGTSRWLKQFRGLQAKDEPRLGVNVDGISGATISATSMTDSVRDVLNTMYELHQKGVL